MAFNRRTFLSLVMSSLAAATTALNPVIANLAVAAPAEDDVAKAARLTRELRVAWDNLGGRIHLVKAAPAAAQDAFNDRAGAFVSHLADADWGEHKDTDTALLFDTKDFFTFDIYDEASLHGLSKDMIPIALMRGALARQRISFDPGKLAGNPFNRFSDRYANSIMDQNLTEAEREFITIFQHTNDEALRNNMRESYLEYRQTKKGLYIPGRQYTDLIISQYPSLEFISAGVAAGTIRA